jgi:hypothetical protein
MSFTLLLLINIKYLCTMSNIMLNMQRFWFYCTSCKPTTYLSGTQCVALCLIPQIGYIANNTCLASCPYTSYINSTDNTCRQCPNNCGVCLNTSFCVTCINNSYMSGNLCISTCPAGTYADSTRWMCQTCHSSCQTCSSNIFITTQTQP